MAVLNGKIDIRVIQGRIRLETSLDPVIVALCCCKVAIRLLEEQCSKPGSVIELKDISGLVM